MMESGSESRSFQAISSNATINDLLNKHKSKLGEASIAKPKRRPPLQDRNVILALILVIFVLLSPYIYYNTKNYLRNEGFFGFYNPIISLDKRIEYFEMKGRDKITMERILYKDDDGIVFLKTHDTGSNVATSIITRNLCEFGNRKCFLPTLPESTKVWDLKKKVDWNFITRKSGGYKPDHYYPYDVWAQYFNFHDKIYEVVPRARRIMSMCRHPATRFEGSWKSNNLESSAKLSLTDFIRSLSSDFSGTGLLSTFIKARLPRRTGLDATSEEILGLSSRRYRTFNSKFETLLDQIFNSRVVLLVYERLDESLLILRKMMKWSSWESILYINQNEIIDDKIMLNDDIYDHKKVIDLNEHQMRDLENLQPNDYAIYTAANYMLNRYIRAYGTQRFKKDLSHYRRGLANINALCFRTSDKLEELIQRQSFNETTLEMAIEGVSSLENFNNSSLNDESYVCKSLSSSSQSTTSTNRTISRAQYVCEMEKYLSKLTVERLDHLQQVRSLKNLYKK